MSASIKVASGRALIRRAGSRLEVPFGGTHGHLQRAVSANITGAYDEILVSHTDFSGGVVNTGTIGSGGISVISGAFLSGGGILDLGIKSGAIKVDSRSKIVANPSFAAITVATPTFAGGISNAGTLSALHGQGIFVSRVAVFGDSNGGGITNSGTIAGEVNAGIFVNATSTFAGGISNRGQIIAAGSFVGTEINVENVGNFAGGIANSGTISATIKGIEAFSVSTLTGNLVNPARLRERRYWRGAMRHCLRRHSSFE